MNFIESVQSAYKNFFNFSGRASRSEYWYFVLFSFLASLPLNFVGVLNDEILILISLAYLIAVGIPSLAVTARRFQDSGISPGVLVAIILIGIAIWFIAFNSGTPEGLNAALAITGICYFFLVVICLKPGDKAENKYGQNPLSKVSQQEKESLVGGIQAEGFEKTDEKIDPPEQSKGSIEVEGSINKAQSLKLEKKEVAEVNSSSPLETQLIEAKSLFERELISEDEYTKLRGKILNLD